MKYHLVTLMLRMFFMLNLLLLSLILIILNVILLSHYHCCISTFQLCLQYLHVPVPLLVKQLLATAVFVSVLRPLSSVELWAGQIQTAVCQGVKLAALQSIAGGQDCAQQLEKDPSPSSYTHTLPKYPPCAISHLAPQSKGARMILRYKEKGTDTWGPAKCVA